VTGDIVTDKTPPKTSRTTESRIFRRVPKELWPALGSSPGASSEAAIRGLLELRTKQKIDYKAIGRGGTRRSVRLDDDLYDQMRQAAAEDNVNINEFFIHALRVYVGDV
jgi:hypothetical protein